MRESFIDRIIVNGENNRKNPVIHGKYAYTYDYMLRQILTIDGYEKMFWPCVIRCERDKTDSEWIDQYGTQHSYWIILSNFSSYSANKLKW